MDQKIKTVRRFNQRYKSLSFSELMHKAEEEYLELVVEMDGQGNTLVESKFSEDGELEERSTYTYTPASKLNDHILLYALDDVTERRVMNRDEKGRLIEEIKYYGDDSGEKTTYKYDEKDNIIEIIRYDEEGEFDVREEMKYNEKGSLLERARYNKEGKVEEKLTFNQDDTNHQVEELEYNADGSVKSKTQIRFDEKGKEISSIQVTAAGKLISSVVTTYDERGNVLVRQHKDFYSKTIRNAYDEHDRLITQELFDGSGLLLRKNIYEYSEDGNVIAEQTFEIDTSRGGRDKHFGSRYEYEFYAE